MLPLDPVEKLLMNQGEQSHTMPWWEYEKHYQEAEQKMHLDLPVFYFDILPKYESTLQKTLNKRYITPRYNAIKSCIEKGMSEQSILSWHSKIDSILLDSKLNDSIRIVFQNLILCSDPNQYQSAYRSIINNSEFNHFNIPEISIQRISWKDRIPVFRWNGLKNQFHHWLTHPAISLIDGRPAKKRFWESLQFSLLINIPALFLAFAGGIGLGIRAFRGARKRWTQVFHGMLSIPMFWLISMMLFLFAGGVFHWFPSGGVGSFPRIQTMNEFVNIGWHLILPVCLSALPAIAYIALQVQGALSQQSLESYARFQWSLNSNPDQFIPKKLLPLSLSPMWSLSGKIIPGIIGGSVIIEFLFNIPGMGRLLYDSIQFQDWPVLFRIVFLGTCMTLAGYLLSDLLLYLYDPRTRRK